MCSNALSNLSTKSYPFDWKLLPQPAYLVGGAVRDALLERHSDYLDLDFVLPTGAVATAKAIANRYQAGFVLLDAERQIARVVFDKATVDFAQQEGNSIEADLRRRDYTINAIAYNPYTAEIIDPLQGCLDLQQGYIRLIAAKNLRADPLRLLRAYRQAAQLNFIIAPDTQAVIRQLAPELGKVAAERVRGEISYLLGSAIGSRWLQIAWEDRLLATWFSSTERSHLTLLAAVDRAAIALNQIRKELTQSVRQPLKTTWLDLAKLACLVNQVPELAETELIKLTYSRAEIRGVTTALKVLPRLQLKQVETIQKSLTEQYFLFRAAGVVFPTVAVLAVAHGTPVEAIAPLIERYINPDDPVAHPVSLIDGKELMQALRLPSSPLVGELLMQIQLAQIEGKVATPVEAIAFALQLVQR